MLAETERGGPANPLRVEYTELAEAQVTDAYRWFLSLPFYPDDNLAAAERWLAGLAALIDDEAEIQSGEVSLRRRRAPESSPTRERCLLLHRTAGPRSSAWHVVYELVDADGDGITDTLRVVRVRHARAAAGR